MAIQYPIILPEKPGLVTSSWVMDDAVGVNRSPFSRSRQAYRHQGAFWRAECQLPPMTLAQAERWIAALGSCKGPYGTFLLQDYFGDRSLNQLVHSQWFAPSILYAWTFNDTTVGSTSLTSPTGTADAFKIDETAINSTHYWQQNLLTAPDDADFVASLYVKPDERTFCQLWVQSKESATAWFGIFNLSGSGSVSSTNAAAGIRGYSNSWYRIYVSANIRAGTTTPIFRCALMSDAVTTTYLGVVGSGIEAWGADMRYGVLAAPSGLWNYDAYVANPLTTLGKVPRVKGGSQSGETLELEGLTASAAVRAGQYLQLMNTSASQFRTHRVMRSARADGSGVVILDIWPRLRYSPTDQAAVTFANCKAPFSLDANFGWSTDAARTFGINFMASESLFYG